MVRLGSGRAQLWSLVLAGGDGSRLSVLTQGEDGQPVPKQFCSFGGRSLLEIALERAAMLSAPARRLVVVTAAQRRYWEPWLHSRVPAGNIAVQPANRGTAPGILLPLLTVLRRDPRAVVVLLPSDHFVDREWTLGAAIQNAASRVARNATRVILLGMAAEAADEGYGWIRARGAGRSMHRIETFVEKPGAAKAAALLAAGGLLNSFILVARAAALLGLVERCLPDLAAAMATLPRADTRATALADLYERLPSFDFSRHVLEPSVSRADLWVLPVPPCGWSDLGTPDRLARAARRWGKVATKPILVEAAPSGVPDLADRAAAWAAALRRPLAPAPGGMR